MFFLVSITIDISKVVMDWEKIKKANANMKRRGITRQMAFIRRRAKSILRRRKRVSRPGEIPSVHSTDPKASLKAIFFLYDSATGSGMVGPVKINQTQFGLTQGTGPAPEVLEHGGTYKIREAQIFPGVWRRVQRSYRPDRKPISARVRRVVIKPRPFMDVALQKEIDAGTMTESFENTFG